MTDTFDRNINCIEIANNILKEVAHDVEELKRSGVEPQLIVVDNGTVEGESYIKQKQKACEQVGIKFRKIALKDYNNSIRNTHCPIIFQMPSELEFEIDNYSHIYDVDGLGLSNQFRQQNRMMDAIYPCTPLGIMEILKPYKLEGKHVVVVGRSNLVGKPLARMLLDANATVTVCHSKTSNLAEITKTADILVVAAGKPRLITRDYIKKGVVIVDVGIHRDSDGLFGDVDYNSVYPEVSAITPVPRGVGRLTVAMLMYNVVRSYKLQEATK